MSAWFRPKKFGYGATPVAWQGWAVIAIGVIAIAAAAYFATEAVVLALIWIVSRRKTEGEWRWRWGDR